MNKTLTSWLSVVVVFLCLPLFAWNGSGTYEDPWQIADEQGFNDLYNGSQTNTYEGSYFIQTGDVIFPEGVAFSSGIIGSPSVPFRGFYDGDGYIVSNMTINAVASATATTNVFGLFGYVDNGTIENVTTYGTITVSAGYNENTCVAVGGVVGFARLGNYVGNANYCDITVSASVNVISGHNKIWCGVGGVYGIFRVRNASLTYYPCYNYGSITLNGGNGLTGVAGIANFVGPSSSGTQKFKGFQNFGSITASGASTASEQSAPFVGGLFYSHIEYAGGIDRVPNPYYCENYGEIISHGSYHCAGIISAYGYFGSETTRAYYCTNYADIIATTSDAVAERTFISGVVAFNGIYTDGAAIGCVNYGGITVSAPNASGGRVHAAGILAHIGGYALTFISSGNKNYGDISVTCAGTATVSGICAAEEGYYLSECENYGTLVVDAPTVYVGGIGAQDHTAGNYTHPLFVRNCANFGRIVNKRATVGVVGGLIGGDNVSRTTTTDIHTTISNSYSLARYEGNKAIYGGLVGCANVPQVAPTKIYNCYCLLSDGEAMIGVADTTKNNLIISNCVAIVNGGSASYVGSIEGEAIIYQSSLTDYSAIYHSPSVPNISADIYTAAYKTTNYFDLVLPINATLFPVITSDVKQSHNWTNVQGYKRYIRTIQQ